jgi:nicotinate-nucleotide--dimethylbenzimidazole phosphoribosyltransferase
LTPALIDPTILVFAADHGAARHPVSAYPQAVTAQMVHNFLAGGAGINVFSRQHGIAAHLVDCGVAWPDERPAEVIDRWIGPGTASYFDGDAMTTAELERCFAAGRDVVAHEISPACTVLGFGEIGIGNTASAALIVSALCDLPIERCAGPGSGLTGEALATKIRLLAEVQASHPKPTANSTRNNVTEEPSPVTRGDQAGSWDPYEVLRQFGGFELAQMAAAMLAAAERNLIILVDGYTASAAFLAAARINPAIRANAVFSHESDEPGHALLLEQLEATPLLRLGMRLGEGTGCAIAYPIVASAAAFLVEMADFASAGVSTGAPEAEVSAGGATGVSEAGEVSTGAPAAGEVSTGETEVTKVATGAAEVS